MATRRPKVPRAAAPAASAPAAGRGEPDGGDVIRADFGGSRQAHAPAQVPGPGAGRTAHAVQGRTASGATGASAAAKPGAAASRTAPGAAKGPAANGAAPGTAKGSSAATPGSRPVVERAADSTDPVPAKAFSGRMLALALVMVAITILLAPTVKIFLEKRSEIAGLQADITASQAKQADLKRQISRWQDPNFVKQQARDRINMVMPGETGYWVFGSDIPADTPATGAAATSGDSQETLPWVDSLWESIRRSATD